MEHNIKGTVTVKKERKKRKQKCFNMSSFLTAQMHKVITVKCVQRKLQILNWSEKAKLSSESQST